MGQALYRKYRSKSLDEVVGQPHVTKTLKNALSSGKISHAFLLAGPRGVGKTSVARIIAHAVNDLPYDESGNHLDIIEIDAASNRRIDEIRDLRDKISIAPSSAKYKVYIVDEVHMLTREAMSALLKTLEEPPAHAIFILATTEAHKLPATIISRTQKFNFKPIGTEDLYLHLKKIAQLEKIKIDEPALKLIAEHGQGSFRDAIGLLDQARNIGSQVSATDVENQLGITDQAGLRVLLDALLSKDAKTIAEALDQFRERGLAPAALARQLGLVVRDQILNTSPLGANPQIFKLLEKLVNIPASPYPFDALEICLLEFCLSSPLQQQVTEPDTSAPYAPPTKAEKIDNQILPTDTNLRSNANSATSKLWLDLLAVIKQKDYSLYSLMRMAKPTVESNKLIMIFDFAFHHKKITKLELTKVIEDTLHKLSGVKFIVSSQVLESSGKNISASTPADIQPQETKTSPDNLQAISNIFGGIEVLD